MKRTLLITLEYPPIIGGVAHYYENLIRRLPREHVWVLDNHKDELLYTSKWLWPKWIKGFFSSWKAVKQYSIEHILVGQVLPIGTIALILKKLLKVRYTVMTHAMDVTVPFHEQSSSRKKWLVKTILKHASQITTVSTYTRRQLESLGVPAKKISIIFPCPNIVGTHISTEAYDMEKLNETYQLHGKRIILSVGRLVQRKGYDVVIAALSEVLQKEPEAHYVVVGDGPHRATLETLAAQHQVQDHVTFVGSVSNEELVSWYLRCSMLVMPSRELENRDVEGFGIVFLEANSFSKPVIGGKSGGIGDAVIDGETGFLVDPTDQQLLEKAIIQLLKNREQAKELGQNGAQRVKEIFQWKAQAKRLEKILQ